MARLSGRGRVGEGEGKRGAVIVEEAPAMSVVATATAVFLDALRFLPPPCLRRSLQVPSTGGKRAEVHRFWGDNNGARMLAENVVGFNVPRRGQRSL